MELLGSAVPLIIGIIGVIALYKIVVSVLGVDGKNAGLRESRVNQTGDDAHRQMTSDDNAIVAFSSSPSFDPSPSYDPSPSGDPSHSSGPSPSTDSYSGGSSDSNSSGSGASGDY